MRCHLALTLVLSCAAAASGCSTVAATGSAGVSILGVQQRTPGQGIDDAAAVAEIKSKFARTDAKAFASVGVQVAGGRALLSGTAAEAAVKSEAERLAWTVRQIRAVSNEIEVGPKPSFAKNAKDDAISAQVRMRMFNDPTVRAIDVDIETHNGVVYLTGLVGNEDARRRAAEIASVVKGVTKVVCYLGVREKPTIPTTALRAGAPITMAGDAPK
jgi:osmotically-inducible protein OsmY